MEANLRVITDMVREAARKGADLVAFPENAPILSPSAKMKESAAPEEKHPAVDTVVSAARETGKWVLLGSVAVGTDDPDGRLANRSILVNPEGEIVARYDKIHMFDADPAAGEHYRESDLYLPGEQAVVAETPWGILGMIICYDMRFPELSRTLACAGAWFISVPAAFTRPTGEAHWKTLLRARAIETGSYVFAPAQCGLHYGKRRTWGHSLIIDPWGRVVASAGEEPELIFADLDPALSEDAHKRVASLRHDRPWEAPPSS